MAKMFVRGKPTPVEISDETKAKELKEKWLNGTLEDKIEIGNNAFEKKDIKGFSDILKEQEQDTNRLDNPEYKEEVLQYEKDLYEWLEENPKWKWKNNIWGEIVYLEAMGAVKLFWRDGIGKGIPDIQTILKMKLYDDLQKKSSDWHSLKSMEGREMEDEKEIEDLINEKL